MTARRGAAAIFVLCAGALVAAAFAWRAIRAGAPPARDAEDVGLEQAIADVERGSLSTPLIRPLPDGTYLVTFLARRDGVQVPRIVSDVTGWGERIDGTFDTTVGTMTPAGLDGWYAVRAMVAPGARIEYLVAYGVGDVRVDPFNRRQSAGPRFGGAHASEFVTPGYIAPPPFAEPPVSGGAFSESTIRSRALKATWRVVVHRPPGVRATDPVPVLVMLDLRVAQVTRVIDWLVSRGDLAQVLCVFVGPAGHSGDVAPPEALRTFLTRELPGWIAQRYAPAWESGRRGIVGISFHAKDALDAGLGCRATGPERSGDCAAPYDRVGLLVPGRRISPDDVMGFARRAEPARTVAVLAGAYDQANVETARRLRTALTGVGHTVWYREVPEGHSAVTWTHHVGPVLVSLFGRPGGASAGRK